jgi:signal transduction histidine kinase
MRIRELLRSSRRLDGLIGLVPNCAEARSRSLPSPAEQVALEAPAIRAQRLVRAQVAAVIVASVLAALFGLLGFALPSEDRPLLLTLAGIMVMIGGLAVGLTDVGHGRNVRALIQTASQLRQSAAERAADLARINAELVRRDAERASLLATMPHELRTPLSSILGLSRALADKIDGDLNAEQEADVRQIHACASGLLGIVNRTLDFAKLEAGRVTLAAKPVQVWSVVEEVAAVLRPLATARGLDLDATIQPGLPPVVADEEALRQILINLVGNAVKFTDVGRIRIRAESSDARLTIAVADTGRGIEAGAHEVIFDPFRQIDPGSIGAVGGTGLGLAIARRLVQMMGGAIWVESEPAAGSTFYVSLPVAQPREVSPPATPVAVDAADIVVVGDPARFGPLPPSFGGGGSRCS